MSKMYLFYMLGWCLMVGIQATSLCMNHQDGINSNQSLRIQNKSVERLTSKTTLKKIKNLDNFGELKLFASIFTMLIGVKNLIMSGENYSKLIKKKKQKIDKKILLERRNVWQKEMYLSCGVAVVGVGGVLYSLYGMMQYN